MNMFRIRPDLAGLAYALIALAFGSLPANAQAPEYDFTPLVTAPGVPINSFQGGTSQVSVPTINNSGVVAYRVFSAIGNYDLVLTDGSSTITIDLNSASGFGAINAPSRPFINDLGAVAVSVQAFSGTVGNILRINPDGSVTILATLNNDGVSGDFKSASFGPPTMNNAGQVAIKLSLNSGVAAIVLLDDSAQTVIDTEDPALRFSFSGPAINDAGVVAYKANTVGGGSVFTGDGISPVQIGLTPPVCGNTSAGPDINNNGLIASNNPSCLVVGSGGVATEVIVDAATNPFATAIGRLSLNDLDQIVFDASTTTDSTGSSGLYFGDDPVNDKLIDVGDSLFGETVGNPTGIPFCCGQPVRFAGEGGFNDQGQVVFLASTVSESNVATSYLFRADLLSPPDDDSDSDGVLDGNDLCPNTAANAPVDDGGCSDAQVDGDGDGVCDPGAPSDGPSNCTGEDNCPADSNPSQMNFDGDTEGDACDADDDNDGDSDVVENACGANPFDAAETCANVDTDNDGVADIDDVCTDTEIPEEPVPTATLKKNRYALKDNSPIFDSSNRTVFTTTDTGGCSCEQIIDASGLGGGHVLFGCSKSAMQQWSDQVN